MLLVDIRGLASAPADPDTHSVLQCCSPDGTVYDLSNIVPYIQQFHRHPVTGAELQLKDIVQLTFHRNAAGEYHCPVLNKSFTEHTHILAVKPTGNVYCGEVSSHAAGSSWPLAAQHRLPSS